MENENSIKQIISNALQEKRARTLEKLVLNSKNTDVLFSNRAEALWEISSGMSEAVNYPAKFETMIDCMYSHIRPGIKGEMIGNFAKGLTKLDEFGLLSESALNFATEAMMAVDSSFGNLMKSLSKKEKTVENEEGEACIA